MIFVAKVFNKTKIALFPLLLVILLSNIAFADWQSTLEKNFNTVETFDQLKDWTGTKLNGYSKSDPPVKIDGATSIWGEYSCYNATSTFGNWIDDHAGSNEWVSGHANDATYHKSLCIDYDNSSLDRIAYGPSRLRTYIGDGNPANGYKDVYVFMMVKITSNFYPAKVSGSYPYSGYHKFLHMSTGFRDVHNWGTVAQQALVVGDSQGAYVYGLNYVLVHTFCGDTKDDPVFRAKPKYSNVEGTNNINGKNWVSDASFEQFVDAGSWFGVEMHFHLGTVDGFDGYSRFWIYDTNGKEVGDGQSPNVKNIAKYNHKFNMLNIGGNRESGKFAKATVAHYYIDDVIVHGSRIGPKYFLLLGKSLTSSSASSIATSSILNTTPPPTVPKIWVVE